MRRRQCSGPQEHKFTTYEVDASLKKTVLKMAANPARIRRLERSAQLAARNELIVARLRKGEKCMTVAADFGLSDNMVSTIARRAGLPPVRELRKQHAAQQL